jgi:hypothetical protein
VNINQCLFNLQQETIHVRRSRLSITL